MSTQSLVAAGPRPTPAGEPLATTPDDDLELTVLMPCLNEAETLAICIEKATRSLDELGVRGEVLIADNGSTDGSIELAESMGARVLHVTERGYGAALRAGIRGSRSRYVLMADSDDSYDLATIGPFVDQLRAGNDLVMGNRFKGGIEPGAMPGLHRLGNPVLSWIGRLFFDLPVGDVYCGMRAFDREAMVELDPRSPGMEFAIEMVVRSSLHGLQIAEVPTRLSKDGRSRPPHLRTWRDGWRSLRFLLLYSPRWLFYYPGLALMLLGIVFGVPLTFGSISVGSVFFDVQTLLLCSLAVILGTQLLLFAAAARSYALATGLLPPSERYARLVRRVTPERGFVVGLVLFVLGLAGWVATLLWWRDVDFGDLDLRRTLRLVIPTATFIVLSLQVLFGSFLVSLPQITRRGRAERRLVVATIKAPAVVSSSSTATCQTP